MCNEDNSISEVFFDGSEFRKEQITFDKENTGDRQVEVLDSVKEHVLVLLQTLFGDVRKWLGRVKLGDEDLAKCELSSVMKISLDRESDGSNPELDAALAAYIMIDYGSKDNAVDNVLALHISKLMEKLEPFILSALEELVAGIVLTLSNFTPREQEVVDAIQSYLKTRNRSVSFTNDMVQKLSRHGLPLWSVLSEHAQNLAALEQNLLPVWKWLSRKSRLALGTSDAFTLHERISAANPAITILKSFSNTLPRNQVLAVQDAVWQIIRLGAGLQVIFFSATKVEFSGQGAPIIFVIEWLTSTADLSRKIQADPIKRLLQHSTPEEPSDFRIVLLPAVNASDFNDTATVKIQRPKRFQENFTRRLSLIRNAFGKLTEQPHALFLHISDPSDHRFIESTTLVSDPNTGLCLSKNINIENACLLLSEPAATAGEALPFPPFERSKTLHTAQSLSAMKVGSSDDICLDSLQASFDALSWFSSVHGMRKNIGTSSNQQIYSRMSQRELLSASTLGNIERISNIISQDRRSRLADALADSHRTGGTRTTRTIRYGGSDSSDDGRNASPAGSANHLHDREPDSVDAEDGEDSQPERRMSESWLNQTIRILHKESMTRSIQINLAQEKESSEVRTVDAVVYMLVLPDVDPDGKVSRHPVATYIAETSEGHFVNCTCKTFSEKARTVGTTHTRSIEVWLFQAKHSKHVLFCADQVEQYCLHIRVRDPMVKQKFAEQAKFKRTDLQCSVYDYSECRWNQTSITVTAGLQVLDLRQQIEVVSVKFTGGAWNGGESSCFSVLSAVDNEDVNCHAFVRRIKRRMRLDSTVDSKQQLQLSCLDCHSNLLHARGRRSPCVHIQSVSRSMSSADQDRKGAQGMFKARKRFRGTYDPTLVKPDCDNADKRTGFVFYDGTYTNEQHDLDFVWKDNELWCGHGFGFDIANEKNRVLHGLQITSQDGQNPHYCVGKGLIIKGGLPTICPRCRTERGSSKVKAMPIILYMSDLAVVHSTVDYWLCSKADCRLCVHTSGYSDGFWFLSKDTAISNMLIWDYITLQMQGRGHDMATYHSHCSLTLSARMGSSKAKLFSLQRLIEGHLVFISCLAIAFNTPCYGCTADATGELPESTKHSDVQNFANRAPEGARDISCVGLDGLARVFADTQDFEGRRCKDKDQDKDASEQKSSVLGSCKCCTKKMNFASRQFHRSPIKRIDGDGGSTQATATSLRKAFHELGRLIKHSRARDNMFAISDQENNSVSIAGKKILELIMISSQPQLQLVLGLVDVCAEPNVLCMQYGIIKTQMLLRYTGEFLMQLSGSNSVLTLLKPGAVRDCLACCDAIDRALARSDASSVAAAIACHAAFKSLCQTHYATPGPLAPSLTTLLEFVDLRRITPLQSVVNTAVVSALRFVAQRTEEVMVLHKLHNRPFSECDQAERDEVREKGFEFPVPVRFPGVDMSKEFTDEELGINASPLPSNPVEDNGAYFFTKTGSFVREPIGFEGQADPGDFGKPLRPAEDGSGAGDPGDCGKPGYKYNGRAGRAANQLMAVFMYCACHGMYMGYHGTRNEGRKDPWNVFFRRKRTFPHNVSYDYACG